MVLSLKPLEPTLKTSMVPMVLVLLEPLIQTTIPTSFSITLKSQKNYPNTTAPILLVEGAYPSCLAECSIGADMQNGDTMENSSTGKTKQNFHKKLLSV